MVVFMKCQMVVAGLITMNNLYVKITYLNKNNKAECFIRQFSDYNTALLYANSLMKRTNFINAQIYTKYNLIKIIRKDDK